MKILYHISIVHMYVGARGTASWTLEKCKWNAAAILVGHQNIGRELHLRLAHSTFPFAAICDRAYLLYGVFGAAINVYTYRRTCAKFWELIRRGNDLLNQLAVFDFEQDRKIWPSKWWLRLFLHYQSWQHFAFVVVRIIFVTDYLL